MGVVHVTGDYKRRASLGCGFLAHLFDSTTNETSPQHERAITNNTAEKSNETKQAEIETETETETEHPQPNGLRDRLLLFSVGLTRCMA